MQKRQAPSPPPTPPPTDNKGQEKSSEEKNLKDLESEVKFFVLKNVLIENQVRAKIGRIYEKIDGFVAAGIVNHDQVKVAFPKYEQLNFHANKSRIFKKSRTIILIVIEQIG